jgi:TonB-dependent SusC/RagA subfamily outer membrane receptor
MIKKLVTVIVAILLATSSQAQTRVIHGSLTVYNTYPVQNIEIVSKKGKSSTISDSLGQFSIVCMEEDVIKIKPKAFKPVNQRVGPDTDSLEVNLVFIDTRKNREIAVGYGYVNERDLTYAVSNLEQENNEYCHYSDIYEVIIGRFAGVVVENRQVIIRGSNSFYGSNEALYVVDGATVTSIDWISPCDLKSISIMKDGSAAVYGSRGSNGVVIIETKRGLQ